MLLMDSIEQGKTVAVQNMSYMPFILFCEGLTETSCNDAKLDLSDRIQHCREILGLSESVGSLTDRFVAEQVIEIWLSEERKMRARRQA
jgi:hypothetical protein